MRSNFRLLSVLALAGAALSAHALVLLDTGLTNEKLVSGDPTQLGRLSRSGVPSDWSAQKAFPGILNASTSYHYKTYDVNVGITNYVQISVNDPDAVLFVSAYSSPFNPSNFATGYMGDEGATGNIFGNPATFQVVAGLNSTIQIVVADTVAANGGLNHNYGLLVEGFTDSMYSEPVPEPATMTILALGAAAALRRRKA